MLDNEHELNWNYTISLMKHIIQYVFVFYDQVMHYFYHIFCIYSRRHSEPLPKGECDAVEMLKDIKRKRRRLEWNYVFWQGYTGIFRGDIFGKRRSKIVTPYYNGIIVHNNI